VFCPVRESSRPPAAVLVNPSLIFLAVNVSQLGDRGQMFVWLFSLFGFGMAFFSGWSALRRFPA
jgi:hypothetical protein